MKRFGLALASLAITLLCVEGCLQIAHRALRGHWRFGEEGVFRVHFTQPVDDGRGYTLSPGYRDERVEIGGDGFRIGSAHSPDADGDENLPLVVAIGDSVPFGMEVANDESYPALLESALRERGVEARVINAGVPSYNLRQSFERLDLEVLPIVDPDLVIVHAANDMTLLASYGPEWTAETTWADRRRSKEWASAMDAFVLASLANRAMSRLRGAADQDFGRHSPEPLVRVLESQLASRLDALAPPGSAVVLLPVNPFFYQLRNLDRNAALTLFNTPAYAEYRDATLPAADAINELFERLAAERAHVHFFDIRARMDAGGREGLFVDYLHHSPAGNRRVAGWLADLIADAEWLGPAQDRAREAHQAPGAEERAARSRD